MTSRAKGKILINEDECKGCGLCVDACPTDALSLSPSLNKFGYHPSKYSGEGCTGCGVCFYACPEPGGITVIKRYDAMTEAM